MFSTCPSSQYFKTFQVQKFPAYLDGEVQRHERAPSKNPDFNQIKYTTRGALSLPALSNFSIGLQTCRIHWRWELVGVRDHDVHQNSLNRTGSNGKFRPTNVEGLTLCTLHLHAARHLVLTAHQPVTGDRHKCIFSHCQAT